MSFFGISITHTVSILFISHLASFLWQGIDRCATLLVSFGIVSIRLATTFGILIPLGAATAAGTATSAGITITVTITVWAATQTTRVTVSAITVRGATGARGRTGARG